MEANRKKIELFYWAEESRYYLTNDLLKVLNVYEEHRAEIEPLILPNSIYMQVYKTIGLRLQRDSTLNRRGLYYLEVHAKSPYRDIESSLQYCDLLMNSFFNVNERLEEIPFLIELMKEAINIKPISVNYHNVLGALYGCYLNDHMKAKEHYLAALAINPNYSNALNNLANILFEKERKVEEAFQLITKAIQDIPKNVYFLNTLAIIHWKGYGNLDEAENIFNTIYQMDNTLQFSIIGLAEVSEAKANYQEALGWYEKCLALEPCSDYFLKKIADLYKTKLNSLEEALPYYNQLLRVTKKNKDIKN